MKVTPLTPDVPTVADVAAQVQADEFGAALNSAGTALMRADRAETTFASGSGALKDAIFERAKADVLVSVAAAAAQRTAQALSTILSMQI